MTTSHEYWSARLNGLRDRENALLTTIPNVSGVDDRNRASRFLAWLGL